MSTRNVVLIILALVVAFFLSGINKIPTQEQIVQATWAQVQNDYQRRMDLIPNLLETVKGSANFEKSTLTDVIEARANATKVTLTVDQLNNPEAVKQFEQAQANLTSTLARLMMVSESYPDLKASANFLALQSQLEGCENRITVSRMYFIDAVKVYNTTLTTFPGRFWAWVYGATLKQSFMASPSADKPPSVKF